MNFRPSKWFAAMLVAGVAGVAATLAGCGSNDSSSGPVDMTNQEAVDKSLADLDIQRPTIEEISPHRGPSADGIVFPTWPVGDVRKQGLETFRIDVNPVTFEGKATLKFMDGSKTLYEVPFNPEKTTFIGPVPAAVRENLKTGDTVKWGLWFEDKKKKPVTASFTVLEKSSVTKKLALIDGDKKRAAQPALRDAGKAEILHNNSLLSEALTLYAGIAASDARINWVYAPMVDCLRRLKLKNTPLFDEALARAASTTSSNRSGLASNGLGDGAGKPSTGFVAPSPQPNLRANNGGGGSAMGPGGAGIAPSNDTTSAGIKTDPKGPDAANAGGAAAGGSSNPVGPLNRAANEARRLADASAEKAKSLQTMADRTKADADAKAAKLNELKALITNLPGQIAAAATQAEKDALLKQLADANAALEGAQAAAENAAKAAAQAQMMAHAAAAQAAAEDKTADNAEQIAQTAGQVYGPATGPGMPGTGNPDPGMGGAFNPLTPGEKLAKVKGMLDAALANRNAAQTAVEAALPAAAAAKAAWEAAAAANDPSSVALHEAYTAAQQAAEAATHALENAQAQANALQQAYDNASQVPGG